ncbi:MAG: PAS domain S-box protein [Deltaproteobacteria bacterium]|nr:PAS domain S-box protein [Deltaproteobacteria bacterium]
MNDSSSAGTRPDKDNGHPSVRDGPEETSLPGADRSNGSTWETPDAAESVISMSRLSSIMLFRVITLTVILAGVVVANVASKTPLNLDSDFSRIVLFVIISLYTVSIVYGILANRVHNRRRFYYLQLALDLAATSFAVHATGGAGSGFSILYPLIIVAAAVVDGRTGATIAMVSSLAMFLAVSMLGYFHQLPPLPGQTMPPWEPSPESLFRNIGVNLAAIAAVTILAIQMSEQLRQADTQVSIHKEALTRLAAHHRQILRNLTTGLISTDAEGTVVTANPAVETIVGASPDDIKHRNIKDVLPQLDGPPSTSRIEIKHSDMTVPVELTVSAILGPDGKEQGRVYLLSDRRELERMQETVQRAKRLAMLGRFASGVAHEVRNPLASISGAIELLGQDIPQDEEHTEDTRLVTIALREIERLDRLVSNLLTVARPDKGRCEVVDWVEEMKEATLLLAQDKTDPPISIDLVAPDSVMVEVNPASLRQVHWNLLTNARDAMPKGGPVFIEIRRQGHDAVLSVRDQGVGIDPAALDHIFEPFFSTKKSGTGLGLAIVHQIVSDLQGTITVESQPGQGTTFWIRLPLHDLPQNRET